jgi:Mn2+/Fe2+ NRAMP family transporter
MKNILYFLAVLCIIGAVVFTIAVIGGARFGAKVLGAVPTHHAEA